MMENSKSTKRALLTSALALLMCVAMLVGATFAWFTDTASTGVNKIQAGNLDVKLEYATEWNADGSVKTWADAEGKTLPFLVNGKIPAEGTQILWEPGCTYYVPEVRVLNKGNLAVKFEYVTEALGITGKLAKVLKPVFKTPVDANDEEVNIEPEILKPGEASPAWSFGYHMDENAGNEYQNATVTGMCLTVVAKQATYEKDSISDQYDKDATWPVVKAAELATKLNELADGSVITVEGTVDTALTISKPVTINNLTATAPVTIASKGVTLNAANIKHKALETPALVVNPDVTDVTITNSAITAATGKTGNHTAVSLPVSGKVVFTGNTVTNDYNGIEFGLKVPTGDGTLIANNNFTNIGNNAISIYQVEDDATVTVKNNTFTGKAGDFIPVRLSNSNNMSGKFVFANNTVDTDNSWNNCFVMLEDYSAKDAGVQDFTKYTLVFKDNTVGANCTYTVVFDDQDKIIKTNQPIVAWE